MKKIYSYVAIFCVAAVFTFGNVMAQPAAPYGKKWNKVENLSDEFDVWDGTKWTKSLWNYGEPVQMVAENSGVWQGYMWIRATLDNSSSRWFKTSRIQSKAQIKYPMYTECSMKASYLSAFSTFWLNNGDSNNRDEIDICEHNTKPSWPGQEDRPYTMYSQYFVVENGVTERDHASPRFDTRNLSANNPAKNKIWSADYQTLGCYWKDEHNVYFYINGEQVGSVQSTKDFTRSLNIIWDLWTSPESWTGGIASKTDLSNNNINTMYVDWIHTYELVDDPNVAAPFFIINKFTGKKIRSANSIDGSQLEMVPSTWSGDPTKWIKIDTDNGYFYLKNVSSGMYFRPSDDTDGSVLIQRPTSYTGSYTQWKKIASSGDYFYLQNRSTSDYFRPETSADYSPVIQRPTSYSGDWTQWKFVDANTGAILKSSIINTFEPETKPSNILLFPNPATDVITIDQLDDASYTIKVFDMNGKVVKNIKITTRDGKAELNVMELPSGFYVIKLYSNDTTTVLRFIKN